MKMSEKLEIYNLEGDLVAIQDRKEYEKQIQEEYAKTGQISCKVRAIRLLLLTSEGRLYLQKRSKAKKANPGLLDKTIGGHVVAGHSYPMTVVKECAEELGFPSTVLDASEFRKAVQTTNLTIIAVLQLIEILDDFKSKREFENGEYFEQPYITGMYVGYYDGPIRFVDGESCGIESFSIEELRKEISETPEAFTDDLRRMIDMYGHLLVPAKLIGKKNT
jgi:isopentenyldiphosphate isomerase